MSDKARFVGINHVALEVGDIDEALNFLDPWGNRIQIVQYDEIQFAKSDAALRALGAEGLGKTAKAEAEMRDKDLL